MIALALALGLAGCATPREGGGKAAGAELESVLRKHIETLASDDFAGRRPGTDGEAKTLRYLAREWQAAGLESGTNDPANPWFAPVELAVSTPGKGVVRFLRGGKPVSFRQDEATVYVSGTRALVDRAPVVFAGNAGERLEGSELAGRVVLMMWDHSGQAEQRDALLRRGAAAVIAVVRDRAEFASLAETRARGNYRLSSNDSGEVVDGYLTREAAAAIIGSDRFDDLIKRGAEPGFRPVALDLEASLEAVSTPGTVRTHNLIAKLPGRQPGSGAIVVMAHWDHFGICAEPPATDLLCNGAVDNASGLAVQTEVARRLAGGARPARDVYFIATTAEEWGLLGAQAFTENPPVPLDTIVAAFNLDTVAIAPAGGPVAIIGKGLTRLDPGILQVLQQMHRRESDESLAQGYVRRQDGWALLQRDVPAVSVTSAFAREEPLAKFMADRYHQPGDEAAGIDLSGAAEDLALTLALVRYFADPVRWPATAGKSVEAP